MATKKRAVEETSFAESIPSTKRRKLNQENNDDDRLETVPLSTASPSISVATNLSAKLDDNAAHATETTPPVSNPPVDSVNIENGNNKNKNAHEAKSGNGDNSNASQWSFSAKDFSFGDNSWVKQTSNASDLGTENGTVDTDTASTKCKKDTFSEYAGLGFQKALDDENEGKSKDISQDKKSTDDANQTTKDKKESGSAWSSAWADSNTDGTFKLNFNWGHWDSSSAKIDLNPSNKIGWGSTAPAYDANVIEKDDRTQKVLEQMAGEQDTGDCDDDVKFTMHCKVYNLDNGKYIERGKGTLKINTYSIDGDKDKLKARILCRRDQTLTTLINALILKDMKFEKAGSFIRFGVVEMVEESEAKESAKDEQSTKETEGNEKDKDKEEAKETKQDADADEDEDDDIKTKVITFLVKPSNKTLLDTFLEKIKEIQSLIC